MYHYFPGKRDFYVETLRVAAKRLLARTEPDPTLPKSMRLMMGLSAYLDHVEEYAASYTALLKGGIGSDPAAAEIVEECRSVTIRRVLDAVGAFDVPPALRVAMRGWIGFLEASSLDWLARHDLPRDSLLLMMVAALTSALESAQGIDPSIRLDVDG